MKLHHLLEARHSGTSNKIDIANLPTNASKDDIRKAISEFWTDGVFYKGENLYEMYYLSDMYMFFQNQLKEELETMYDLHDWDAQECYLGYIPNTDEFVAGFDTWAEVKNDYYDWNDDDSDEEEYYREDLENMIKFSLDGGGPKDWDVLNISHGMVYPAGYKAVHAEYPKIIDVRLD